MEKDWYEVFDELEESVNSFEEMVENSLEFGEDCMDPIKSKEDAEKLDDMIGRLLMLRDALLEVSE